MRGKRETADTEADIGTATEIATATETDTDTGETADKARGKAVETTAANKAMVISTIKKAETAFMGSKHR